MTLAKNRKLSFCHSCKQLHDKVTRVLDSYLCLECRKQMNRIAAGIGVYGQVQKPKT